MVFKLRPMLGPVPRVGARLIGRFRQAAGPVAPAAGSAVSEPAHPGSRSCPWYVLTAHLPFGGTKLSRVGREQGRATFSPYKWSDGAGGTSPDERSAQERHQLRVLLVKTRRQVLLASPSA